MLLKISNIWILLLFIIEYNYAKKFNIIRKTKDSMTAETLKNITQVNNVLQDLINNYEKLQKIYKSHESFESEYSDEDLSDVSQDRYRKRRKTTIAPVDPRFAITAMIESDGEKYLGKENNETKSLILKPKAKKTRVNLVSKEFKRKKEPMKKLKRYTTTTVTSDTSEEESEYDYSTFSDSDGEEISVPIVTDKGHNSVTPSYPVRDIKDSNEIDIYVPKPPNYKLMKSATDFNIREVLKPTKVSSPLGTNKYTVKKIVRAEFFSPHNIWVEIKNNKPIKLHTIDLDQRQYEKPSKAIFKSHNKPNRAIVIISQKKDITTENPQEVVGSPENPDDLTSDSETDKGAVINEQLQTKILRHAYGTACTKLVIRRCYRACKAAIKTSCEAFSCKRHKKKSFKRYSKIGCIKFLGTQTQKQKYNLTFETKESEESEELVLSKNRSQKDFTLREVDETIDKNVARVGYFEACFPDFMYDTKDAKLLRVANVTDTRMGELNILRDRYETACKKESARRCRKGCLYGMFETCSIIDCNKELKKKYKKQCKSQCKISFGLESSSDTDSDSNSGSSSSDSGS